MNHSKKPFALKLFATTLPFVLIGLADAIFLPVDYFSHRPWESIFPQVLKSFLPGAIYPNLHFDTVEEGDLAYHTQDAVKKTTHWESDDDGYRNSKTFVRENASIVIVGDSASAGTSLSQNQILAEQLQSLLPVTKVYNYAPASLEQFWSDLSWLQDPKLKLVIFPQVERTLTGLNPIQENSDFRIRRFGRSLRRFLIHLFPEVLRAYYYKTIIFMDRLLDPPLYHFIQARIKSWNGSTAHYPKMNGVYFLQGEPATQDTALENIQLVGAVLQKDQEEFQKRSIQFLFVGIPNKETYYSEFWRKTSPNLLPELSRELVRRGVNSVDLFSVFSQEHQENPNLSLYHSDDTHWNAVGVSIAAKEIAEWIKKH